MTYKGAAVLAFIAAVFAVGFSAGFNARGQRIDECADVAEQQSEHAPLAAQAYFFAKCMNPRRYDTQYDYNRFKGK